MMFRKRAVPSVLVASLFLLVTLASPVDAQPTPTKRTTGKPTALKVTVTKAEMWNGSSWVSLFTGSAQLDMVAGGNFPGIANINLPGGTYSKLRITVLNAFVAAGSLTYSATRSWMTSADGPAPGLALATTNAAGAGEYTFFNPAWGSSGAAYTFPEMSISRSR